MKRTALSICLALAATSAVANAGSVPQEARAIAATMPAIEVEILDTVGREYGLTGDQLTLLFAIRKIENGRPGVEMGVGSDTPGHRARRYAGDFERSLRLQARWAAGTIQKRYTGDIAAFARRYCPPNWNSWTRMARFFMSRKES
ncbi:MAG: hypothetical protein QGH42_12115 [Kiritimatiellia bacterium]|jgi:hypothetical protein|nr:hypothetical protein [Kiritimatiellia bacterium]MDP6631733.1 hypothetical protein [Kiritimatiellia bacterium]MDP6810513.1 hypothetical protein [Kiritimatiellia bacterium]MDP7024970.1 hypothetical protein [Kiritimatiellia bacterium]